MSQEIHGMSQKRIYRRWTSMMSRCYNKNSPNYKNYGERGIGVCARWNNFENFYEDMGDIPFEKAQIDRIDNEKGYSPENCKWSTPSENSRNRRSTKYIDTHEGKLVQAELLERIGWSKEQLRWFRSAYGMEWVLEGYKNGTLHERTNFDIDPIDLVGQEFGDWNVLSFESYLRKDGHLYKCECRCGTQRLIPRDNLRKGKTTKCRSCAAKEQWARQKSA